MAEWLVVLKRERSVYRRFRVVAEYEGEAIEKAGKLSAKTPDGWDDAWIDQNPGETELVASCEENDSDEDDEDDEDEEED